MLYKPYICEQLVREVVNGVVLDAMLTYKNPLRQICSQDSKLGRRCNLQKAFSIQPRRPQELLSTCVGRLNDDKTMHELAVKFLKESENHRRAVFK